MKAFSTSKKRIVAIGALALLLLLGLASVVFGRFGYTSVCTRCGAEEHATDWHLFGSQIILFNSSKVAATPFSDMLTTNGAISPHQHQWMFAAGGGNGVKCAIGDGRHLWSTIRSTNIATLLVWNHKYADAPFQERLLRLALAPDTAREVEFMTYNLPTNGFNSAQEYKTWLDEELPRLEKELAIRQQAAQ